MEREHIAPRIATIGGYGFTEPRFREVLLRAGVDTFVDIRQRRGLRGSAFAFLNSRRLQNTIASLGIRYLYEPTLAPTASIRDTQKRADERDHVPKRSRRSLSQEFVGRYESEVLANFDVSAFRQRIGHSAVLALFCVEREPSACHRSLAARLLQVEIGPDASVLNLLP